MHYEHTHHVSENMVRYGHIQIRFVYLQTVILLLLLLLLFFFFYFFKFSIIIFFVLFLYP